MSRSLLFATIASLTLVSGIGYRSAKGCGYPSLYHAPATITVKLPEGAKLFFDDEPTTSTGAERTFISPPIPFGRDFEYTLRLEVPSTSENENATQDNDREGSQDSDQSDKASGDDPEKPDTKPSTDKGETKPMTVVVTRKIMIRAGVVTTVDFGEVSIQGNE